MAVAILVPPEPVWPWDRLIGGVTMRMLRFTIRELVLLVALVAMGLGWWVHVRRLQADARRVQSDLLYQADLVDTFAHFVRGLGCEIPPDSDPRCAAGGPYTRIFVSDDLQAWFRSRGQSAPVSCTASVPRQELQRTGRRVWRALPRRPSLVPARSRR